LSRSQRFVLLLHGTLVASVAVTALWLLIEVVKRSPTRSFPDLVGVVIGSAFALGLIVVGVFVAVTVRLWVLGAGRWPLVAWDAGTIVLYACLLRLLSFGLDNGDAVALVRSRYAGLVLAMLLGIATTISILLVAGPRRDPMRGSSSDVEPGHPTR
jgi:hypothetical protein